MRSTPVILALLLLTPVAAASAGGPLLEPPASLTHDFGQTGLGEPVRHTFELRNAGSAPLTLTLSRPLPGVQVTPQPLSVPAGGRGELTVAFDGTLPAGPAQVYNENAVQVELPLLFDTNDPDHPTLALTLRGELVAFVKAKPGYARWDTAVGVGEATIGQTLWSEDGSPFKVLSVDSPASYLRTSFREARPEERNAKGVGTQWRVEVTLADDAPVGAPRGNVVVRVDHPKQRQVPVPVSGFVRPLVFVDPPSGELGTFTLDTTAKVVYRVRFFSPQILQVTGAEVTVPGARATVEPLADSRYQYQVTVDFPETPPGEFSGKLLIKTSSPRVPVYELALSGTAVAPTVTKPS
jgi:hypothetical protein